jgi:hypothetical protein
MADIYVIGHAASGKSYFIKYRMQKYLYGQNCIEHSDGIPSNNTRVAVSLFTANDIPKDKCEATMIVFTTKSEFIRYFSNGRVNKPAGYDRCLSAFDKKYTSVVFYPLENRLEVDES